MSKHDIIDVAVGVVVDDQNRVLVTQRAVNTHQGGKWEFPGGKAEPNEEIIVALKRELDEELGIQVVDCESLIDIKHIYPEKTVHLHVYRVLEFSGTATGQEQQPLKWQSISTLDPAVFPTANVGIIQALQLPSLCLITPELGEQTENQFLSRLETSLKQGIKLIQFRSHALSQERYLMLAEKVQHLCKRYQCLCLLNMPLDWHDQIVAEGIHLTSSQLLSLAEQGYEASSFEGCITAACHNEDELQAAIQIGVNAVFISPILATPSHPDATTIGWEFFQELATVAPMPVFALGGLTAEDLSAVRQYGGQGVAGISHFWPAE